MALEPRPRMEGESAGLSRPPKKMNRSLWLAVSLGGILGMAMGLGGYTFVYARGASYLTNDPTACANCHVMNEQLNGWTKSSHRRAAACNDCHTPPEFLGKYYTKALNGYRHSWAFTTGRFHEPIQISAWNRAVTENACRHCHGEIVQAIDTLNRACDRDSCIRCHSSVGHMH